MRPLEEIAFVPFRRSGKLIYYFDENGILHESTMDQLPSKTKTFLEMEVNPMLKGVPFISLFRKEFFGWDEIISDFDEGKLQAVISAAVVTKPGESIQDFERHVEERKSHQDKVRTIVREKGHFRDFPSGLDRFLVRIEKPLIIRFPDNPNTRTFDIIKVQILLCSTWESDIPEYVKQHEAKIINRVIEKIDKDRSFKKYGVPVNILTMTSAEYLTKDTLELIFEVKRVEEGQ